ncbi:MAG: adenosylcobinamide-phosphate synthase CbiB [Pseudomonadota bacterium]
MITALLAVVAAALDRLLGEPRRFHPLVGFGRLATAVEGALCGGVAVAPASRRLRGALAVAVLIVPLAGLAHWAAGVPVLGVAVSLALLYLALGARSLEEHAERVAQALAAGDLAAARERVGWMVSRDTAAMSPEDVARATVESVLENGNDAVFGALFWFAVAGAPGVVAYRLANTLDAMWGYRTERYLRFGWAAARFDDLLNFVPARLTALTYAAVGRFDRALACWRSQAGAWESFNAGPVMAAGAGALGLRLGGAAVYHGTLKERPPLGEGDAPTARDIRRALALVRHGVWLWLGALLAIGAAAHA